jgi:hypothetical protein
VAAPAALSGEHDHRARDPHEAARGNIARIVNAEVSREYAIALAKAAAHQLPLRHSRTTSSWCRRERCPRAVAAEPALQAPTEDALFFDQQATASCCR